jgi:hypothetical protein
MRTEVRISSAQARQHQADLLSAIGVSPQDGGQWTPWSGRQRKSRQLRMNTWWRRLAQA